ncbi:Glyoxylate/hydroxypyruvate reductase B [Symmachiella dynata]|uniref:2-hydroxyacid dehydrogenase n=1 Tax=Symmachiella dynata TaxID=2527995 RepID=UPI0011892EBA|nr:D-glycerate dehydrogenase [Symmachiella dynata]QDT48387.1 Glyoxylate/hydroxypyruvate reductase B [Symmachiella dynata]
MTQIPIMGDGLPQPLLEMLGAEFEVLPWEDAPDSPALARAEAIIAYGHPPVDGSLMDRAPQLKVISNHGVGVDHIDVAAALQRGIPVGNTPGCLDAATADMTMALMLATARNVVVGDKYARSPEFLHYDPAILIGQEVTGSKLGIIGMGRIGKQVAKRAAGFDMKITYHNRHRDSEAERDYAAEYRSLNELLAESDFVALNCPLTPETTGLISGPQFAIMKSSAILINMARGPVVDPAALFTALSTGQIAAAGIDVTDPEPLPRGHELLTLENLIITPHLGSASNRTRERMMRMTVENLHAGLQGKPLPYSVDK